MPTTAVRSVLACSLALALGVPGGALAAAPSKSKSGKSAKGASTDAKDPGDPSVPAVQNDGPPRMGRVYVDADGLGDAGPVISGRAMRVARGALEAQAVTITEAPAGPELQVSLKTRDAGGYRVDYVIVYDGKPVKNGSGGFDCQLCTEDELVEKVEALAVQVAPKLVIPEPEQDPGTDTGDDTGPGEIEPETSGDEGGDPTTDGSPDGLGPKGKAGIALLVVGGLGAVAGVTLVVLPSKTFPAGDPNAAYVRSTMPPGVGVLVGGGVAIVVGAVLLGLDRKQAKQRRNDKATARLQPWLGSQGAGLSVAGRF